MLPKKGKVKKKKKKKKARNIKRGGTVLSKYCSQFSLQFREIVF